MTARDVYEHETGRQSHNHHEVWQATPNPEYVAWLERIVERVAGMMNIVPAKDLSIYDHDDLEDLCDLFKRIT